MSRGDVSGASAAGNTKEADGAAEEGTQEETGPQFKRSKDL